MLTIDELYRRLSVGELKNLAMSVNGTIDSQSHQTVLLYLQEALLRLYSKFVLAESWQELTYVPGTETYKLNDDVIKVLTVKDDNGYDLWLNDTEQYWSVFTPSPNTLKIPHERKNIKFNIIYQAAHPELNQEPEECDRQDIEIPSVLEGALRAYIAYGIYSGMSGQENNAKSAEHYSKFQALCVEAEEKDLVNTQSSTSNTRFKKGGWV